MTFFHQVVSCYHSYGNEKHNYIHYPVENDMRAEDEFVTPKTKQKNIKTKKQCIHFVLLTCLYTYILFETRKIYTKYNWHFSFNFLSFVEYLSIYKSLYIYTYIQKKRGKKWW